MGSQRMSAKRAMVLDYLRNPLTANESAASIGKLVGLDPGHVARIRRQFKEESHIFMKGILEDLDIALIRTDGGTQPRAEIDQETVEEYAEAFQAKAPFPPVVVFHDGEIYWLADGFHRLYGAKKARRPKILADIRQGTQRDAIFYSLSANSAHGLRRTNADKRRVVERLLRDDEWVGMTDNQVATHTGVSNHFVAKVREEIAYLSRTTQGPGWNGSNVGDKRIGKDGKSYPSSKIGAKSRTQTAIAEPTSAESEAEDTEPETDDQPTDSAPSVDQTAPPQPTPAASTNGHAPEANGTTPVSGPDADEPPDCQAGIEEDPPGAPAEPPDADWLATLPAREKLTDHTRRIMDRDALKYRKLYQSDQFRSFVHLARRTLREKKAGIIGHFHSRMTSLLSFPHPREWVACPECSGRGIGHTGDCAKCLGRGYLILKRD